MLQTYVFRVLATTIRDQDGRHLTFLEHEVKRDPRENEYDDIWEEVVVKVKEFTGNLPDRVLYRDSSGSDRLAKRAEDGSYERKPDDEYIVFECWGPLKTVQVVAEASPVCVEDFNGFFNDFWAETLQVPNREHLGRALARVGSKEIPRFKISEAGWIQLVLQNGGLMMPVQV